MPDPTAQAEVQAANAAATNAPNADGVTPPNATASADMSAAEARQALNSLKSSNAQRDPLNEESGVDPLFNEGEDPLGDLGELPETEVADTSLDELDAQAAGEAEAEASEAPEPETAEEEEHAEASKRRRLNINRRDAAGNYVHSDFERAQMALSAEEGISLAEAARRLGGDKQATAAPAEESAQETAKEPTAAEIDTQIAELKTKRKEARDAYDEATKDEITEQIEDLLKGRQDALLRDLSRQQAEQVTQQQVASTVEQQVNESRARAASLYPDVAKAGSDLNEAAQAEIDRLFAAQSPLLAEPDYPEIVLARVAARLGVTPQVAAPAQAAKPVAKPAPKSVAPVVAARRATPVPAPGSVSGATPKVDPRVDLERRIDASNDPRELAALMKEAQALEKSTSRRAA